VAFTAAAIEFARANGRAAETAPRLQEMPT